MEQLSCLFNFLSTFYASENNECQEVCAKECFKIEYEIEKTSLQFPSLNYLNLLKEAEESRFPKKKEKALSFAKKSFLKLMVNFKTVEYSMIEENAQMTFGILLGSIGGQLGLFIGISVLSLMEVIELLLRLFYVLIRYCKKEFINYHNNNQPGGSSSNI